MIMAIMLFAITLVGAVALVVVMKFMGDSEHKEPSIEEVLESSVDVPTITTNLASDDFIRMSFKIETDSKDAKEELQQREFQVRNIIIQELSEKKAEDLQGKEGKLQLENALKANINELMQDGKVKKVYITESLLQ